MSNEQVFTVDVNNEQYYIEPILEYEKLTIKFKVSTTCEYMFTLCLNENGEWSMESEVTPLYKDLVSQIGQAIEKHDA